jgi:hypothetical protein
LQYALAGGTANLLFIAGTMMILLEVLIRAIVIAPLFFITGAIGGLAMGAVCRLTSWPKQAAQFHGFTDADDIPLAGGRGADDGP